MVRAMLLDADMSEYFWPLAIQAAVYIKNRVPHKALPPDTSPYQLWHGVRPSLERLRPFGAHCVARIVGKDEPKFKPKGEVGRFVGYARNSKGFLFWHPPSRSVKPRRDLRFPLPPPPSFGQGGAVDSSQVKALWEQYNKELDFDDEVENVPCVQMYA